MVRTYKAWVVLLPLCHFIMSSSTNAAENTPITDPVPSDEEAEDVEVIAKLLEAAKAKNIKIAQKKKECEEVKRKANEAEVKRVMDEAEAKRKAEEAKAKKKAEEAEVQRVRDAEEARKRKVSACSLSVVLS